MEEQEGAEINITPEEAFGIPKQNPTDPTKKVEPKKEPTPTSEGTLIDEDLTPESKGFLELVQGGLNTGASIDKGSELFRLQRGSFTVDEAIDYNASLAANQSFGEQAWNATKNAVPTFAAGFLDNFNYDIPDMVGLAKGEEKEYGSWLSDITKSLRKAGDAPIYQEGDDLTDPTYWLKQGQNFAYTGGLVIGALTEQALLTALTAETLGAAGGVQAVSLMNKGKLFKNAAFGTWKGVHEGYINALETYEGTKEQYLKLGHSQAEANKYASEAAALGYKMEIGPLMILNALQFASIGKLNPFNKKAQNLNLGFSGTAETMLDPVFNKIKNEKVRGLVSLGANMGTESVEEIIQTGVGRYAQHQQLVKTKDTFTDFEFWNNEMRDSAIGGAFGGGIFATFGAVSDKIQNQTVNKAIGKTYDDFILNNKKRTKENLTALGAAIKSGDVEAQRNIEFKMQRESVFEALKVDYTLQKDRAYDSHIKTLQKGLKALHEKDVETLKQFGLTDVDDFKNALETFPKLIEQAENIKKKFIKNYTKSRDFTVAATITDSEVVNEQAHKYKEENKKRVADFKKENFANLTTHGKTHIDAILEMEELVMRATLNSITPAEKKKLESLGKQIEDQKDNLSTEDVGILEALDIDGILNTYLENEQLIQVQAEATERIKEWSRPEKAKEIKIKQAAEEVKKATSKENLENVKESLKTEEALTPEIEEVIESKIVKAKAKATVPEGPPDFDPDEVEMSEGEAKDQNLSPEREENTLELNDLFDQAEARRVLEGSSTRLADSKIFQPVDVSSMPKELKDKIAKSVGKYYNNLKQDVSDPTFVDFIKDFIKHNSKDSSERIYHALAEGWKDNKLPEADFDQIYRDIFEDRAEVGHEILGLVEGFIGSTDNEATLIEENKETLEEALEEQAPTVAEKEDLGLVEDFVGSEQTPDSLRKENNTALKDTHPFRTSQSTLKANHLSVPYKREYVENEDGSFTIVDTDSSDELYVSEDLNSTKLLNPDLFNPGTTLDVEIPPNYMDMKVSVWEDAITRGPSVTFRQWMINNKVEKGSPEWIAKVPMVAKDSSGEGVFLIHDTDWYNPSNLGFKDKPQKQFEIIQEANKNLMNLRNKLKDGGSVQITITEKRPGTWKQINKNQDAISLQEANPQSQIALANEHGELILNASENFGKNGETLINNKEKKFKPGHVYDVRRATTKDSYVALGVLREKISEQTVDTLIAFIEAYLYQYDKKSLGSNYAKTKQLRDEILNITGKDVFDMVGFEELLNLYIPTSKHKVGFARLVAGAMRGDDRVSVGSSFFAVQNTSFVFGKKGQAISGNFEALYVNPKKVNDPGGPAKMKSFLSKLRPVLENAIQNVGKDGLEFDVPTVIIDKDKNVIPGPSYREHLRSSLKTSIKSFNIGTKEKPVFATIVQPVINFEITGEVNMDVANPTPEKVAEVKEKIKSSTTNDSSEQKEVFPNSKVKQDLYHGTKNEFDSFEVGEDGAMHFGDEKAAKDRVKQGSGGKIVKKVKLNIENPVEGVDSVDFEGTVTDTDSIEFIVEKLEIAKKESQEHLIALFANEKITKEQLEQYWNKSLKEVYNDLFNADGYYYTNKAENKGSTSYVVFDSNQISIVDQNINESKPSGQTPLTKQEEAIVQSSPEKFKEEFGEGERATLEAALKTLRTTFNLPESSPEIQALKKELGLKEGDTLYQPVNISPEEITKMKQDVSGVPGLSIIQDFQVTDYIFNELSKKVDFKYGTKVDKQAVLKEVKSAYFDMLEPERQNSLGILSNLKDMVPKSPGLAPIVARLEKEVAVFDIIKKNWKQIEKAGLEKMFKFTGIKESQDVVETSTDNGEVEKNYSKTSLEEGGKTTASYRLKRFLAGVKAIDASGKVKTGFLGVPSYIGFDTAYSTIEQVLSSPVEVDSSFDDMMLRLEENVKTHRWLRQVIEQLKTADQQIKNEFVYNFTRHSLSMKFTMFSKNRDGTYTLKVYDTNSTEVKRVIRSQWENNLNNSSLVYPQNGVHKISTARAKKLLADFQDFSTRVAKNPDSVSNAELQDWLEEFGIVLSDDAMTEMREGISYTTQDGPKFMKFENSFRASPNTAGIYGLLASYLKTISAKTEDVTLDENPQNHPFDNANNALKTLAKIESKYTLNATTNSFRDGGKSIYGFTATKLGTDLVKKLKGSKEYRQQLLDKSFSEGSFLLDLLNKSEAFREKMQINHLGITAMKELGKKAFGDNSITSLSNSDHELTKLGMFQDKEQGELKETFDKARFIGLRMARMFFPTMSDKSQMLMLYTAVLDLTAKHFVIEEGKIDMREQVVEALYSQTVLPELKRLTNYAKNIKNGELEATDIDGYDMAAQMFLMIPELNNLVDDTTGETALSLMLNEPNTYGAEWFAENMKEKANQVIKDVIDNQVSKKLTEWEKSGFVEKKNGKTTTKFLNQKYLDTIATERIEDKIEVAAYDYVINTMINNANIHMTVAGDIAMYSKDKKIGRYFNNGDVAAPKSPESYVKAAKEISTNMGKRLALLLAPGNKIANSKGDSYKQIFLNDFFDITTNVETLVELFYGTEESKNAAVLYKAYQAATDGNKRKSLIEELKKKYPEISDYFALETTDAQEYTTLSEHLGILYRQGRLHSTQYNTFMEKVLRGEDLTYEELKVVMQPIKPVYTGFKNEDRFDAMRMMYIKSSSYPLLPQLTKGLELDKLRIMLETQEANGGKKIRASYASANKVGASTNAISIFNPDGTYNDKLTDLEISKATLVLDRDNFRIQQDVPFKSAKKREDRVTLGTQTLKLLFGDGMLDIDDFMWEGVKTSGRDLYNIYRDNFDDYVNLKKQGLYKELGVDAEGQPIDVEKTMHKLQRLLKKEAEGRGYPKQDIEALKLIGRLSIIHNGLNISLSTNVLNNLDANKEDLIAKYGEENFNKIKNKDYTLTEVDFSIPLWLSPNSNRYESLLNSIVTSRTMKMKIPGNSYILGSEAGYKFQEGLEGIDQSKIIFTSKWQGKLKAYEKGALAQVLVPSKFRDNDGNLIDLLTDEYTYRDDDGVLRLREDKVDPALLGLTSFRIPTSSHVSMSQIEIAGILPTEIGDLMILPKNFTAQKGIDFDVDKETAYQLHTYMDKEGNIRVFDEHARQEVLKSYDKAHGDASAESTLLRSIFGEDVDFLDDEFEPGEKLDLINDKLKAKILENDFIKIHAAVLSNPNEEVQRKINTVLSMDFAKSQASLISGQIEADNDDTYFTMLSDTYQKDKLELGASGKLGIGVYSNYVVMHSMIQQAEKPISLKTFDEGRKAVALHITIGNQTSNGKLGNKKSLAPGGLKRSIAEAFAERQNTATDNEKEQIMGKVNVNEITINVDSLMTALGFDKDIWQIEKEEYEANPTSTIEKNGQYYRIGNLPYLLLSQPIIREYVTEMRKTKSNTSEYDSAAKERVIENLFIKYATGQEYDKSDMGRQLTGQALYNNLTDPSKTIQTEVLEKFLLLDGYATKVSKLQKQLNISDGLGKSYFETVAKYHEMQAIPKDFDFNSKGMIISNASNLIGDFKRKHSEFTKKEREALLALGYIDMDTYMIKPNNPVASLAVNTIEAGYKLWKNSFPYDDPNINFATKEILKEISSEDASTTKTIELQQDIFKEMKKYLVTSSMLEVFDGDPGRERQRLFIDSPDSKSLANYMNTIIRDYELLKSNKLLSRFQYTINKNGQPSLIKFDNSKGENFDEDYLYLSLIELMEANMPLPEFNGSAYTTRDLAQDLIAYNYLEGGIQEAVQFSKYIPVSYLNTINFATITREWNSRAKEGVFNTLLGIDTSEDMPSRFVKQYLQNNPQRLSKVDPKRHIMNGVYAGAKKDLQDLMEFQLDEDKLTEVEQERFDKVNFVAIYNSTVKKGLKKFQIYQRSGDKFVRVSSLGVFGMAEYSIKNNDTKSIVNANYRAEVQKPVKKVKKSSSLDVFNLDSASPAAVTKAIAEYNFVKYPHLKPLAEVLMPFISDNLVIKMENLVNDDGHIIANGSFTPSTNTIYIDNTYRKHASAEDLAKTILHEIIHGLSMDYIDKHVDKDGNFLSENPPQEIVNLVILFNEVRRKLGPEYQAYIDKRAKQISGEDNSYSTTRETQVAYGGYDIREFVTIVLTEPAFQKEMNFDKEIKDVMYKQTKDTLLQRLAKVLKDILGKVLGDAYNKESLTSQSVLAAISVMQAQKDNSNHVSQAESNMLMDMMAEQMAQGEPDFDPDTYVDLGDPDAQTNTGGTPEIVFSPKDFIWKYNKKFNLDYTVKEGFPLSKNMVERVTKGEQEITIRKPEYANQSGVYEVDGRKYMVEQIGGKDVTIDEMKTMGYTEAEILKAFKGGTKDDIREQSIKDWFNGEGTKNVFFVKDVTDSYESKGFDTVLQPSSEFVIFDEKNIEIIMQGDEMHFVKTKDGRHYMYSEMQDPRVISKETFDKASNDKDFESFNILDKQQVGSFVKSVNGLMTSIYEKGVGGNPLFRIPFKCN